MVISCVCDLFARLLARLVSLQVPPVVVCLFNVDASVQQLFDNPSEFNQTTDLVFNGCAQPLIVPGHPRPPAPVAAAAGAQPCV